MYPTINILNHQISSYNLLILLSMLSGSIFIVLYLVLRLKVKWYRSLLCCIFVVFIISYTGTKLLHCVEELNFTSFFTTFGGTSLFGSIYLAPLSVLAVHYFGKVNFKKSFNAVALTIVLTLAIAKIGCLLNGCCYGIESPIGFINEGETIVRFPIQLVESLFNFTIFGVGLYLDFKFKDTAYPGLVVCFSYCLIRLFAEFLRDNNKYGGFISIGQIHCLIVITITVTTVAIYYKKSHKKLSTKEN
jgi:phosphatidylglycerol:prolipoprotein diacylglycerol transferase